METRSIRYHQMKAVGEPEYSFWLARDYWKLPEAAKLICGRDPMERFGGKPVCNTNRRIIDIIDQAFDAVRNKELAGDRSAILPVHVMVRPQDFVKWATDAGLEIPDALECLREHTEALPKSNANLDKAITVAKVLWVLFPDLSVKEVAYHKAMRDVMGWTQPPVELEQRLVAHIP